MTIYKPTVITEEIRANFRPTRLYVKRHTVTGIRYFGKTIRESVESYLGSGSKWTNHIKKHGTEFVVNDWISDIFYDPEEIQSFALHFSEANDIVDSDEWANQIPENGLGGGCKGQNQGKSYEEIHGPEKALAIKSKQKSAVRPKRSQQAIEKSASAHRGKKRSEETKTLLKEKRTNRKKKQCPFCKEWFLPGNYDLWHGDNCHKNPDGPRYDPTKKDPKPQRIFPVKVNGVVYPNATDAAIAIGVKYPTLIDRLKGRSKTMRGVWEAVYINDA